MSRARQDSRLPSGGMIDRSRVLTFSFDGRTYHGHDGDTVASALLASGVHLVGRSFKYHRPRGILSAGAEEPNALLELRPGARCEPNTRATTAELYDGLVAASQNRWPSLRFDLLAVNGIFAPLLAAGFYYKTFMWPARFWERVYEPLIRRSAGLGRASSLEDPDRYEKAFLHCDVLVVGGGAAGLTAALAAARSGARVALCEDDFRLGGRLIADRHVVETKSSADWVDEVHGELAVLRNVRILRRTTVVGAYDGGTYAALERVNDHVAEPPAHQPRQRLWRIFAKRCVLAAGAIERPLLFRDNDRPGIMLAGAVRAYCNRFAVAPGRRAVVFASNDETARTIADLSGAGVVIAAIVDPRTEVPRSIEAAAKAAGTRIIAGGVVTRALGSLRVRGVEVRKADGGKAAIACDLLCVSGGWTPALQLACHLGARPVWDEAIAAFVPGKLPAGMLAAGGARGLFGLGEALESGARAGHQAAADCGFSGELAVPRADPEEEEVVVGSPWRVRDGGGKAFVDYQNDVTDADIGLAWREGFRASEHLKRYTTLGMATDQGKTSSLNGAAVMAELTATSLAVSGTTTFRPPYVPVAIGAFAGLHRGRELRPTRLTPSHQWAQRHAAVFAEAGHWLRAQWYAQPGEGGLAAVNREVLAVRNAVGVCDVSTLGKIDLQGADAVAFLDRLYTNSLSTLAVGRVRYGLMLREDGLVLDDGTVSRLAEDRFIITTTTGNAAKVLQHMEFCRQWLWPELDVEIVAIDEQWGQFAIAGPRARAVLERVIDPPHDLADAAFPYLAAGEVTVMGGIRARLFRVSFSGELAYEIAVPSGHGAAVFARIIAAGTDFGIAPYGTEALSVLRIEKGHIAGNEINGQTTARDLGLARMLARNKDYIGRVMAERPGLAAADRPALVGVKPLERGQRLFAGAHFIAEGGQPTADNDLGYMTSVAYSPTLGQWIGLGLLAGGPRLHGERVRAWDALRGAEVLVEVCSPVFYDPQGERLRG